MIPRGVLVPTVGGFEVFVRNLQTKELDIHTSEQHGLLTPRQRLAFAHEIAHTLFYKASGEQFFPTGAVKDYRELEMICDRAAKRLLVPTALLSTSIRTKVGSPERIDSKSIRAFAAEFRASYEVIIDRIRVITPQNNFARCIVLARKRKGETVVTAVYFGGALSRTLPFPQEYRPLADWFSELPKSVLGKEARGTWEVTVNGNRLALEKHPLTRAGDFLSDRLPPELNASP